MANLLLQVRGKGGGGGRGAKGGVLGAGCEEGALQEVEWWNKMELAVDCSLVNGNLLLQVRGGGGRRERGEEGVLGAGEEGPLREMQCSKRMSIQSIHGKPPAAS